MTLLAPAYFFAALAVAAAVVALHFIVTREPRTAPLPTARFVPDHAVRAQSRAIQLQDLLLLAMRVALVLATGLALAQPVLAPARRPLARIIIADRSRAVADIASVADSARSLVRDGDVLILFDSTATVVTSSSDDSLSALRGSGARGRLSVALIAAFRAASVMQAQADSLEIAIVSPLAEEEFDAATDSIRALWRGTIRLISVPPAPPVLEPVIGLIARPNDPIRFALPSYPAGAPEATVRLVRDALGTGDSAWVREADRALVHWPTDLIAEPRVSRSATDTIGAVVAGEAVVVAPFVRVARLRPPAAAALRPAVWFDGEPAAIEQPLGNGCIRTVDIPVPERGDLVLQPRFAALVRALTEPCGGRPRLEPISAAHRAALAGVNPFTRVAGAVIAPARERTSPISRWLLLLALGLALAEVIVRRRITRPQATPA
jgi:hypothetical protein